MEADSLIETAVQAALLVVHWPVAPLNTALKFVGVVPIVTFTG